MKVWVVEEGADYEGRSVRAICSSRESARRIAGEMFAAWDPFGKTQVDADHWRNWLRRLSVNEHEVVD